MAYTRSSIIILFICSEVRSLSNIYFFTSLLVLYFGEVKKFTVLIKAKSAVRRLVRMCLAQPGYGSGLLSLAYYRPNKCSIEFYFICTFT